MGCQSLSRSSRQGVACILSAIAALNWVAVAAAVDHINEWICAAQMRLPRLAIAEEAGAPKFTAIRLNDPPLLIQGGRYGAVRILCPSGRQTDLVWMFSDVSNIDEYRLVAIKSGQTLTSGVRQIYPPTARLELDDDAPRGRVASSLPRPWDLFELHLLGVPASVLVPGEEYLIWFRFSDRRPTDVLIAASFIKPLSVMEPMALPPVLALPPQLALP